MTFGESSTREPMRRLESRHLRVPFLASAQFSRSPRPTLVVVAGEDAAIAFARNMAAYLGEDRVLLFPERSDTPFSPKTPDARKVARRMEAAFSLACGRPCVVVASARALIRMMPPKDSLVAAPLVFEAGVELADTAREGEAALPSVMRERCCVEAFEDVARALEDRGYANTGELDGPAPSPCMEARSTSSLVISRIPCASIYSETKWTRSGASSPRRGRPSPHFRASRYTRCESTPVQRRRLPVRARRSQRREIERGFARHAREARRRASLRGRRRRCSRIFTISR